MILKGWVKSSLIDFPGRIATVVFAGGCDFRCPYCHNSELVLRPQTLPTIAVDEVLAFLLWRRGLIDGVVITGGEPTLQADLPDFARALKNMGIAVKLDTNGARPQALRRLLDANLLDYVAMDIKAPAEKYPVAAGVPVDVGAIQQSIDLLRASRVAYEFRTTVVPGLLTLRDIETIARWVAGARKYVLQQFRPDNTLASLGELIPYSPVELTSMTQAASSWIGS